MAGKRYKHSSYAGRKARGSIRGSNWAQLSSHGHKRWEVVPGGCWEWQLATQTRGYGSTYYDGRTMTAHRAAWIDSYGPIPPECHLHHTCENKRCCNPDHLELLTAEEHADLHVHPVAWIVKGGCQARPVREPEQIGKGSG